MKKVFLAEDDETMVRLLETLLKIEGFDVESIDLANGDLLSSLRDDIPQALVLDVNLPNQNGMDVVREMRKEEIFKDTRVVMASGQSLKDECLASGADDFLLKPYMPDDLITILRRYTQG
ncbi:MAG: response regulator [Anaerolineae bacterium]|jgi:DNA-binding response OmpR family regulator|nr:response regulator [Anaerolineae bacterium]MBT3714901.1 response regulator [Anaerolineae bacterium]MBT4309775.1 response regulator [Anaerolineae bacterium]MBT4460082.1 response regulator [Anaerolineae bacterium]MBT4841328.1 response regulator [Anaerolineae bacterium]